MASITKENDDSREYVSDFDAYACEDEKYTRDVYKNPSRGRQNAPKGLSVVRRTDSLAPRQDFLPITYELMELVNSVKVRGNLLRNVWHCHDFAAERSHQIARGGYFQTRRVPGLGVAKYPLLSTASTDLSLRSFKALATELRVLSHPPLMKHGNIVKILTIGWTRLDPIGPSWIPMVFLELAELGTLTQYLAEKRIGVDSKIDIANDIGRGLQALHSCGITHGDLKFDNILMFKGPDNKAQAKLSDFGCSMINGNSKNDDSVVEITAGTKPWNSPELGQKVPLSLLPHVDTYCFGLLVWRLYLNGRSPFDGQEVDDIEKRKLQDLMISDASMSLEDEYDKQMLLLGKASSEDRSHHYMRSVSMVKRCFRHTLTLSIRNRNLDKALDSLSSSAIYGTTGPSVSPPDQTGVYRGSTSVSFFRLFDTPRTVKTMLYQCIQKVAEDDSMPRETRAHAYLQLGYANIDAFGTPQNISVALESLQKAAALGSVAAGSCVRRMYMAAGAEITPPLENSIKGWLSRAVESGSMLARHDLRLLDPDLLQKSEESLKLWIGARTSTGDRTTSSAHNVDAFFLPINREVMKRALAPSEPWFPGFKNIGMFMSRHKNTFLHAGAAVGVDAENFRSVVSFPSCRIDEQDEAGNTPLILAMRFSNVAMARILLEGGANSSLANERGETAWHWLVSVEDNRDIDDLVELLSHDRKGLETIAKSRNSESNQYSIIHGGTPLHWAVDMGSIGLASALVRVGADPLKRYRGVSPIDLSIQYCNPELLDIFLGTIHQQGRRFGLKSNILTEYDSEQVADFGGMDKGDVLVVQVMATRLLHERYIYRGRDWLNDMRRTLRILRDHEYLEPWGEGNAMSRLSSLKFATFANPFGSEVLHMMTSESNLFPSSGDDGHAALAANFWCDVLKTLLPTSEPPAIHFAIDHVRSCSETGRLREPVELLFQCCISLNADVSVVESILKDCEDIDHLDEVNGTPFMAAVRNRNFDIATCLLRHGADANKTWIQEGRVVNILYEYLVCNLDIDVIPLKYLLEPMHPFPEKVPSFIVEPGQQSTALRLACQDGNTAIVEYILSKFGTKDYIDFAEKSSFTALHFAVSNGHADMVMRLCSAGADVNARSGSCSMPGRERSRPLDLCYRLYTPEASYIATKFGLERTPEDVYLGRLRAAEYLVRRHRAYRASRQLVQRSLAHKLALVAAEKGMTRLLSETLQRIKRENDSVYPAVVDALLWIAAERGNVGATRLLLRLGADANQRSRSGRALLHVTAWRAKAEIVYVLVKTGGADVNAYDAEGQTPGSYAIMANDLATLRVVKSFGGYFTLRRSLAMQRMREAGIDPTGFDPGFNLRFNVACAGEPSDEEPSDKEEEEDEADTDNPDEEEASEDGVAESEVDKSSDQPDAT